MSLPPEPAITINGVELTTAQAMTLRVALGSFIISLRDPEILGPDKIGRDLSDGYLARAVEVSRVMHMHVADALKEPSNG